MRLYVTLTGVVVHVYQCKSMLIVFILLNYSRQTLETKKGEGERGDSVNWSTTHQDFTDTIKSL